jgi:hypothetical protein
VRRAAGPAGTAARACARAAVPAAAVAAVATLLAADVLAARAAAETGAGRREAYAEHVVGLSVTYQGWNEDRPWAKTRPGVRTTTAVVVEGGRLLTTAQMLEDATFMTADKFGRPTRARPRIAFVDPEINLALLSVDDPQFFADLKPAPLAPHTPVEETLRTVRWRNQQLESAASRVKRYLVESSYLGQVEHAFLTVQTDLDGGGWAEPVFADGRLVGITVSQDEQRARVIPVEILARFLERARRPDAYRPFPVFGALWQLNTDAALTAWLGQTGTPRGILIRQVPWGSSGCGTLKPWDILLEIDGRPIDAEGFFAHPRFGRLRFPAVFVTERAAGDTIPIRVMRGGRTLDLTMTLRPSRSGEALIPSQGWSEPPPFLIAGGLVFRELTGEYLQTWGREWSAEAPLRLVSLYSTARYAQAPDRRRIVILKGVIPSSYTIGYHGLEDLPVVSVNGVPVDSLADVDEALRSPADDYHTIVLEPNGDTREVVLDAAGLEAATDEILEEYRIPSARRLPAAPPPDPGPACPGDY